MAGRLFVRLISHDGLEEDVAISPAQFAKLSNASRLVTMNGEHSYNFKDAVPAYYSPEYPQGAGVCLRFVEVTDNGCYLLAPDAADKATLQKVVTSYALESATTVHAPVISAEGAY